MWTKQEQERITFTLEYMADDRAEAADTIAHQREIIVIHRGKLVEEAATNAPDANEQRVHRLRKIALADHIIACISERYGLT